jgi:hypothetical protein
MRWRTLPQKRRHEGSPELEKEGTVAEPLWQLYTFSSKMRHWVFVHF